MMIKRLFLLSVVMWLCGTTLMATSVSRQQAQQIAAQFLSSRVGTTHRALSASEMQVEVIFNKVYGTSSPFLSLNRQDVRTFSTSFLFF